MAIEDILRQIGDDAMAKSDGMLSGARAEAEVVIEKARKSAERFRAEAMQKAGERAKEHARRIETLAGLELRGVRKGREQDRKPAFRRIS